MTPRTTRNVIAGAVAFSIVSRLVGLARESAIIRLVGVHSYTDAYFAVSTLVMWLQNWAFGAFALFFIPRFLAIPIETRSAMFRRYFWGLVLVGALAGAGLLACFGEVESLLLSGRRALGTGAAAILCATVPVTVASGVVYASLTSSTPGILTAAKALLIGNVLGFGALLSTGLSPVDPSLVLPISLLATQSATLVTLLWGRRVHSLPPLPPSGSRPGTSQVVATTLENIGFNVNAVFHQGAAGMLAVGAVTMNAYATRLILVPITGLLQPIQQRLLIRFSTSDEKRNRKVLLWTCAAGIAGGTAVGAAVLLGLRLSLPLWSDAWQDNFREHRFGLVLLLYGTYAGIVFANQTIARYAFATGRGWAYASVMVGAYAVGTMGKLWLVPQHGLAALPLCALLPELIAAALLVWLGMYSGRATTASIGLPAPRGSTSADVAP
jgi:hypothetical protein